MAQLDSIPDAYAQTAVYSQSLTTFNGLATKKYSPKDLDGNVIDLTGYNAAILFVQVPNPLGPGAALQINGTIGTADSTGIEVSFTGANIASALSANGYNTSNKATLRVGDGTDTLFAAQGTFLVSLGG
jgi:hypothetical protein